MSGRPAWAMAKFTGQAGGPVYIDLLQVAAVTEVIARPKRPHIGFDPEPEQDETLPGMPMGARVILFSGVALFTREAADTVFAEVHRARIQAPPAIEPIRVGNAPIGNNPDGTIFPAPDIPAPVKKAPA